MVEATPKLPELLARKIYKTGQTRGADDDVIYQNRVGRNSTVLIPYKFWSKSFELPESEEFENGFIVLISPKAYFETNDIDKKLEEEGLRLGINTLVFYYSRDEWDAYNPKKLRWKPATSRTAPLGGKYVARVPATTATKGGRQIREGFTTTSCKGAGIRVFEYASSKTIAQCRLQLEALFWLCRDSERVAVENNMPKDDASNRKSGVLKKCAEENLLDYDRLRKFRMINKHNNTICPLCLEELSGLGFFSRMEQAEGREVSDITVTQINLFHVEELRVGKYNHRPYNLGWGHHHCNVVTRDSGVADTIKWLIEIIERNKREGFL